MRTDAASALKALGFEPFKDFVAAQDGPSVSIQWLSALPMPTEALIDAVDLSPATVSAREDAKEPLLADIKAQAAAAIAENDAFIAITGTLTNAQRDAQLRALTRHDTREIKALARLAVRTWR